MWGHLPCVFILTNFYQKEKEYCLKLNTFIAFSSAHTQNRQKDGLSPSNP